MVLWGGTAQKAPKRAGGRRVAWARWVMGSQFVSRSLSLSVQAGLRGEAMHAEGRGCSARRCARHRFYGVCKEALAVQRQHPNWIPQPRKSDFRDTRIPPLRGSMNPTPTPRNCRAFYAEGTAQKRQWDGEKKSCRPAAHGERASGESELENERLLGSLSPICYRSPCRLILVVAGRNKSGKCCDWVFLKGALLICDMVGRTICFHLKSLSSCKWGVLVATDETQKENRETKKNRGDCWIKSFFNEDWFYLL